MKVHCVGKKGHTFGPLEKDICLPEFASGDATTCGVVGCLKGFKIFPAWFLVLHRIVISCPLQLSINCPPVDAKIVRFSRHTASSQSLVQSCHVREVLGSIELLIKLISQSVILSAMEELIPIALRHV
jgi:hypothetical protein